MVRIFFYKLLVKLSLKVIFWCTNRDVYRKYNIENNNHSDFDLVWYKNGEMIMVSNGLTSRFNDGIMPNIYLTRQHVECSDKLLKSYSHLNGNGTMNDCSNDVTPYVGIKLNGNSCSTINNHYIYRGNDGKCGN